MKTLQLRQVVFAYGNRVVLKGVDLEVERGQRVVIWGKSGCGKSTLLSLVAGFLAPKQGEVLINGRVVARQGQILVPPYERGIGMVFQDLALWPHMSVRQNLLFPIRHLPLKQRENRIAQMLRLVDMEQYATCRPSELSGGQKQRVALARALVAHPSLLLMDEPLSSLDFDLKLRLIEVILSLQKELDFTLLYVTHDRGEAEKIANRVVVLRDGCLHDADAKLL